MTLQEVPLLTITLQDVLSLIRVYVDGLSDISVEAGIVNIIGYPLGYVGAGTNNPSTGAIVVIRRGYAAEGAQVNAGWSRELDFNASRSSSIYGNSKTVTPLSLKGTFIIRY